MCRNEERSHRLADEWDEWLERWEPLADPDRDLWESYEALSAKATITANLFG